MHRLRGLLASFVLAAVLAPFSAGTSVAAGNTFVVDDDLAQCPNATFTMINAAVIAAGTGDTIKVCAGTYMESVLVNKSLTIKGTNHTRDDCFDTVAPDPQRDAIVNPPGVLTGTGFDVEAANVAISGFIVTDADKGIFTSPSFGGYDLSENTLLKNRFGIHLHSDGTVRTNVEKNCIRESAQAPGGDGIFSNMGLKNARIRNNRFYKTVPATPMGDAADISMFGPTPLAPISDVEVSHNKSLDSATFIALSNTTDSEVSHNDINGDGTASGIFDGGDNTNVVISHNKVEDVSRGIRFGAIFFGNGPSSGLTIAHNKVDGATGAGATDGGIVAAMNSVDGSLFDNNRVKDGAGQGIYLQTMNTGNTLVSNDARGNAGTDCRDDTTGTGTAGTANTWEKDKGDESIPAGICRP